MKSHFRLPASLPTGTDLEPIPLGIIAFKLSENKHYFCQHEPLLFRSQYLLCAIVCPLFIHSNRLIFLLETKVLTFHKGIKVLTFYARC